tara:strand:+ start:91 stop:612 length:522 start_codon:yes stop_codon:yes gene_type:complete
LRNFNPIFVLIFIAFGCGVYSFTGASISPDVKTISIETYYNNSPLGPSNMSVLFTEKLKDYFQKNTSLTLVDEDGDLQIEGTIDDFSTSPIAPTAEGGKEGQYFTGLTRLTIRVTSSYLNTQDEQFNYDNKSFSFYKDFDQNTEELSSNEQEFLEEIFDQIIIDIFNSSVANW